MPEAKNTDTGSKADGSDSLAEVKELFQEQRERQDLMRHVQQFLKSPLFLDLRAAPVEVSDTPEAILERKEDLDYRIRVLKSLLTLLQDERDVLENAISTTGSDADGATAPTGNRKTSAN